MRETLKDARGDLPYRSSLLRDIGVQSAIVAGSGRCGVAEELDGSYRLPARCIDFGKSSGSGAGCQRRSNGLTRRGTR
jgi:hypothetical protein